MSKYSRMHEESYWVRRQRAQSIQLQKQLETQDNCLSLGYSIPLQYQGDHKRDKSADIFHENKISTCSFIKKKGDDYEAVPFYQRPFSASNMSSTQSTMNKSFYKTSMNTEAYRSRAQSFAGMGTEKPLEVYNPNAQRSRLKTPDLKQFYVNRSVIEIGNRNVADKKHYTTTNLNQLGRKPHKYYVSKNPAIISSQIRWDNSLKTK